MSQIFRDEAEIFRILQRLLYFYVKNYAINSATAVVACICKGTLADFKENFQYLPNCGSNGFKLVAKWFQSGFKLVSNWFQTGLN